MLGGKGTTSPVLERELAGVAKSGLLLLIWFVFLSAKVDDSGSVATALFVQIWYGNVFVWNRSDLRQEDGTATTSAFQTYVLITHMAPGCEVLPSGDLTYCSISYGRLSHLKPVPM